MSHPTKGISYLLPSFSLPELGNAFLLPILQKSLPKSLLIAFQATVVLLDRKKRCSDCSKTGSEQRLRAWTPAQFHGRTAHAHDYTIPAGIAHSRVIVSGQASARLRPDSRRFK